MAKKNTLPEAAEAPEPCNDAVVEIRFKTAVFYNGRRYEAGETAKLSQSDYSADIAAVADRIAGAE